MGSETSWHHRALRRKLDEGAAWAHKYFENIKDETKVSHHRQYLGAARIASQRLLLAHEMTWVNPATPRRGIHIVQLIATTLFADRGFLGRTKGVAHETSTITTRVRRTAIHGLLLARRHHGEAL